jgi:hypothetical protein
LDPRPWVTRLDSIAAPIRGDAALLGGWGRTLRTVSLRASASTDTAIRDLEPETVFRILAARADWYHVALPDRSRGFLPADAVTSSSAALRVHTLAKPTAVRDGPAERTAIVDTLRSDGVQVFGRFGDYLFVRLEGEPGWITIR